jgi:hypothetical protein
MHTTEAICDGPYDCRSAHVMRLSLAQMLFNHFNRRCVVRKNTDTAQQMVDDEVKEVVNTAHGLGRKVAL